MNVMKMPRKQFALSCLTAVDAWPQLQALDGNLAAPTRRRRTRPMPLSRREFMQVAVASGTAVAGLGAFAPAARAEPVTLVITLGAAIAGFLAKFIPAAVAGITAGLVLDRLRSAPPQPRSFDGVPVNLHFPR